MRFGKKLALMAEESAGGCRDRPFLSHRALKDTLSKALRMIRVFEDPSNEILQFRDLLQGDHERIHAHLVQEQSELSADLDELMREARGLGIFDSDSTLQLVSSIQNVFLAPSPALHACVGEGLRTIWIGLTLEVAKLADKLNKYLERVQSTLAYADLNIAGFRKLRKQYEKQISQEYRIRVLGVEEYRDLMVPLFQLVEQADLVRCSVEQLIQALSPGTRPLIILKVGPESLLALSGSVRATESTVEEIKSMSTAAASPSTSPGIDGVPGSGIDILEALEKSGINMRDLQSRLLSL